MKKCYFFLICIVVLSVACEESQSSQPLGSPPGSLIPNTKPLDTQRPWINEDYTNTERVIWQKPDMIISMLGEIAEKKVIDVGAGTGFFSLRLAKKADHVIALDIDPRFTNYLDSIKIYELPHNQLGRLETRLATTNDPKIKDNEADYAIIVNTYMYIENRVKYLKKLRRGIRSDGKILIVDFKKKRTSIGPPSSIRIPLYQVEEELYEAGFKNVKTYDTALDYQYILLAER